MKILYISTVFPRPENSSTIYTDLAEALAQKGHSVTVVAAEEKKKYQSGGIQDERGCKVLRVKIGNMYDVNLIEKGISVITLSFYMKKAIKNNLSKEQFDLILFEAPPATLVGVVQNAKKLFHAPAYLMMKDIFPQNAIDIGLMKRGIVYYYFRLKEKQLYKNADVIGCMSEGNRRYIMEHNDVPSTKVEIFPNTKKIRPHIELDSRNESRDKYKIPRDKVVFIFGGNMGKPQGLPFLCKAINTLKDNRKAFFVLVGRGTEKSYVEEMLANNKNVLILDNLPRNEYEKLVRACDVGIVSLDHRFTIPNYPSRVLSYMEYGMPVLATTDKQTDFKELIEEANSGLWCCSDSVQGFVVAVRKLCSNENERKQMGQNGRKYAEYHFNVDVSVGLLEKSYLNLRNMRNFHSNNRV